RDPVTSCTRCEPGLTCVDGRCQTPCTGDAECPCGEVCNGNLCGPPCAAIGASCTAAVGRCGTCTANPLGPPRCEPGPPIDEGCGGAGVDDACDGLVDETALDGG